MTAHPQRSWRQNQPFNHSTIQPFNHSTIQPFNHSTIQSFNHSIIQSFNHSIIQSFNYLAVHILLCFGFCWLNRIYNVHRLSTYSIKKPVLSSFDLCMWLRGLCVQN
ncbi:hypothetical protein CXF82_09210 [Shewanella sp. GutDb-MelDb]|nr:hypothetical protein CXF82_09210 [Shewanella sp. GutDb-MelDb]